MNDVMCSHAYVCLRWYRTITPRMGRPYERLVVWRAYAPTVALYAREKDRRVSVDREGRVLWTKWVQWLIEDDQNAIALGDYSREFALGCGCRSGFQLPEGINPLELMFNPTAYGSQLVR